MVQATYPHTNIDIQDNSGGSAVTVQQTPMHLPCFFIFAEKGEIGIPYYGQYSDQVAKYGANTFLESSAFFQHPSVFAKKAAQYQPIYVIRLADNTVTQAGLVLEAVVTTMPVTQYQLDGSGARVLDSNGNPLPQLMVDGVTPVTAPGVSIKWMVRALSVGETYNAIATTTTTSGGHTVTTYPIIADLAKTPGSAVNRSGFSLYYTPNYDSNAVASTNSMTYRFAPAILSPGTNGVSSKIFDTFNATYNDVSLKTTAIDSTTNQDISLNAILQNNYVGQDSAGNSIDLLDYDMYVYSANVATIGAQIITLSSELSQSLDPFMINILTGIDQNGNNYHHAIIDPASTTTINSNVILYHTGGTDGTLTKTALETLTTAFCQSTSNPDFQDTFRYPFTHFYDSGYALATKYAMAGIFSLRDDVKIDFSTQDVANAPNTAAQDQSAGAAILAAVSLYPESVIYGTEAMRASIYQQCGLLASSAAVSYAGYVPATLDRMIKRCIWNNGIYIKGSPKGRPNSEVTVFKKLNWTEATVTQKQLNWDTALNTIGYADMSTLFYADLRSIYPDQTSLLSDDVFVDYLIYLKHIVRNRWTYYAGMNVPVKKQFQQIATDIDSTCSRAFVGVLPTKTTVFQTALDQLRGYSTTVSVAVTGTAPNRIWNVIVPVSQSAA